MTRKRANGPSDSRPDLPEFVELPNGLFTSQGVWFHTTAKDLKAFAGPVLDRVRLGDLLSDSSDWLRSPGTFTLWVLLGGLLLRPVGTALLLGVVGFLGWSLLAPGLVLRPLVRLSGWLANPFVVGAAYVSSLSWLGSGGSTIAVVVGLVWFVAIRWGLIETGSRPLVEPIVRRLYRLPPPDQILRALIIRHALALRVSVGDLDDMERRMLEIANRHRKQD